MTFEAQEVPGAARAAIFRGSSGWELGMNHKTSMIGLGGMGRAMLGRMAGFAGFTAACGWDPSSAASAAAQSEHRHMRIADSAEDAIRDPETSVVYIASPPATHFVHAMAALEAGKAVFCEKPLGVDGAQSRALVEMAETSGAVNIVNISLASATATERAEAWLVEDAGELRGIDIRIHFSQWPRQWQIGASSWLGGRAEGGFTREVMSHWVYLTERLVGRATLEHAWTDYPDEDLAETQLLASLRVGDLPVSITGTIGGVGPDQVDYTIRGSRSSARISNWGRFMITDGGDWEDQLDLAGLGERDKERQLANAAAAIARDHHTMPTFADALSVQELVEAMLT